MIGIEAARTQTGIPYRILVLTGEDIAIEPSCLALELFLEELSLCGIVADNFTTNTAAIMFLDSHEKRIFIQTTLVCKVRFKKERKGAPAVVTGGGSKEGKTQGNLGEKNDLLL